MHIMILFIPLLGLRGAQSGCDEGDYINLSMDDTLSQFVQRAANESWDDGSVYRQAFENEIGVGFSKCCHTVLDDIANHYFKNNCDPSLEDCLSYAFDKLSGSLAGRRLQGITTTTAAPETTFPDLFASPTTGAPTTATTTHDRSFSG